MNPGFKNIHLRFKFNGLYFDREDFKEVAYSLVKEGKPYEQSVGDFLIDWLNDKEIVHVKTSGSTGVPKIITLQKQHMVNSAIASGDFFEVSVGDSALHCLPADFIAGKMMLVRAMILGLEIDLIEPTSNPLAEIEKTYNFSAMIPLQLQNSLEKIDLVKTLIVGGAPVPDDLIQAVQGSQTKIYETYGMTETVTHIAARKLNNFDTGETLENSYFQTLPNVFISKDSRGCLVIDAPNITDEQVVTNDLVNIYSEHTFEWLGRADNVVNSGGIKLVPEQIEKKLSEILSMRFFVAGQEDKELGERLILVIEGNEDGKNDVLKTIKESGKLKKFEIPKEIYFTPQFEETENGKIIRTSSLNNINN